MGTPSGEQTAWRQAIDLAHATRVSSRHIGTINRYASHHLPYHNAIHGLETGFRAHTLAQEHGLDAAQLLLAGWYHDLGHIGDPAVGDQVNISLAVAIWERHGAPEEAAFSSWHSLGRDDTWMAGVTRLIRATEWPHHPSAQLDEQAIRDADLAQTLDRPDWLARCAEETGRPADPGFAERHMTLTC